MRGFFRSLLTEAVAHVRAEARLAAPADRSKPELGSWRKHLELAAKGGGRSAAEARKQLRVPPCPVELEHLIDWTFDLYGRDGFNMGGPNLLSNRELSDYFALRGIAPDPLEVEGLFALNAAYCNPEGGGEEEGHRERRRKRPEAPLQRGREVIFEPSTGA